MLAREPRAPSAWSKATTVICTTPFGKELSREGCIHASIPLSRDVGTVYFPSPYKERWVSTKLIIPYSDKNAIA